MPFKTKKQKAHSAKNRISFTDSGFLTYKNTFETKAVPAVKTTDYRAAVSIIDDAEHTGMRKELAKIFLLSSVIIGLQLALKVSDIPLFG